MAGFYEVQLRINPESSLFTNSQRNLGLTELSFIKPAISKIKGWFT